MIFLVFFESVELLITHVLQPQGILGYLNLQIYFNFKLLLVILPHIWLDFYFRNISKMILNFTLLRTTFIIHFSKGIFS